MRVRARVRGRWAAAVIFLGLAAQAGTRVSYAVAIGYNGAPLQEGTPLPELRFADDDAVRYDAFFARFADHHWLLTVVDAETQRRYPKVSASARPPTLGALRTLVEELARQMTADRARGDEPTLYLTYSGHGAQGPDGSVFFTLADGALTRKVLYEEILSVLPAGFIHLFVDACHAEAVVGTRGASPLERDASTARLAESELSAVVAASSLRRFPGVGVLMATASEQESHEWARLQSGIFTHELLSGLTGAADVNGDGIIEYSELQAFVVSANRDIRDPRALPRVVASPPPLDPRTPLLVLAQLKDVAFLEDDLSTLGHFHVELDDGEWYLDANLSAEAMVRIAVPAGRQAYLVTADREAELRGRPQATIRLIDLRFARKSDAARGSIETSFRTALFQSPFGPSYYRGFADSAGVPRVPFNSPAEPVRIERTGRVPLAATAFGLAAGSLVTSGVLGALALEAQHDYEATSLMRPAAEARQRYRTYGNLAIGAAAAAVVLGVSGWLLWPPAPRGPAPVVVVPWLSGEVGGVGVASAF